MRQKLKKPRVLKERALSETELWHQLDRLLINGVGSDPDYPELDKKPGFLMTPEGHEWIVGASRLLKTAFVSESDIAGRRAQVLLALAIAVRVLQNLDTPNSPASCVAKLLADLIEMVEQLDDGALHPLLTPRAKLSGRPADSRRQMRFKALAAFSLIASASLRKVDEGAVRSLCSDISKFQAQHFGEHRVNSFSEKTLVEWRDDLRARINKDDVLLLNHYEWSLLGIFNDAKASDRTQEFLAWTMKQLRETV